MQVARRPNWIARSAHTLQHAPNRDQWRKTNITVFFFCKRNQSATTTRIWYKERVPRWTRFGAFSILIESMPDRKCSPASPHPSEMNAFLMRSVASPKYQIEHVDCICARHTHCISLSIRHRRWIPNDARTAKHFTDECTSTFFSIVRMNRQTGDRAGGWPANNLQWESVIAFVCIVFDLAFCESQSRKPSDRLNRNETIGLSMIGIVTGTARCLKIYDDFEWVTVTAMWVGLLEVNDSAYGLGDSERDDSQWRFSSANEVSLTKCQLIDSRTLGIAHVSSHHWMTFESLPNILCLTRDLGGDKTFANFSSKFVPQ